MGNYLKDRAKSITVTHLRRLKEEGEKIACLTAYDATFSHLLDTSGIDVILVGDSLGNVIQGEPSTLPVTMDQMVYHARSVAAGCHAALRVADMPFMSFDTPSKAADNAARLLAEGGMQMVKVEGSGHITEVVAHLSMRGIPVCAHLGLTPQSVNKLGGYKVQGRTQDTAEKMVQDACLLEEAGADMLVVECVPSALGEQLSQALQIPVIGIGAGAGCDGQVLVLYDMLGITPGRRPKFSEDFMVDAHSIGAAISAYVEAVKTGHFPAARHCFDL